MPALHTDPGIPIARESLPSLSSLPGTAAAVTIDAQGCIREATIPAAAMLGYEPPQLLGRSLREIAAEGWQAAADVAAARVRYGSLESFELALRGRSGRRTLVEMTASRIGGDPVQALVAWAERRGRRVAGEAEPSDDGRFAYALLRAHESERRRLASLLHDEFVPILVMVRFQLEQALARQAEASIIDPAGEPDATVAESVRHLRDLTARLLGASSALHPRILEDLGLQASIEALCREVAQANPGLDVGARFELREEDIPASLRLEVYRILEEGLANVVAHAGARSACASVYRSGEEICALVEDDGRGFEAQASPALLEGSGVGLQAIRWRVEATGGRLLFAPADPHGARIGAAWKA